MSEREVRGERGEKSQTENSTATNEGINTPVTPSSTSMPATNREPDGEVIPPAGADPKPKK